MAVAVRPITTQRQNIFSSSHYPKIYDREVQRRQDFSETNEFSILNDDFGTLNAFEGLSSDLELLLGLKFQRTRF
jgi:hypothetical protein